MRAMMKPGVPRRSDCRVPYAFRRTRSKHTSQKSHTTARLSPTALAPTKLRVPALRPNCPPMVTRTFTRCFLDSRRGRGRNCHSMKSDLECGDRDQMSEVRGQKLGVSRQKSNCGDQTPYL